MGIPFAVAMSVMSADFPVGFTLLFGVLNVLNLAQGSIFMIGGIDGLELVRLVDLPLPAALVLAMVATGALSILTQIAVFGPLERRGGNRWMGLVASLALARLFVALAQEIFGTQVLRFPAEAWMETVWTIGNVRTQTLQIIVIVTALTLMAALRLAHRAYVLERGNIAISGPAAELVVHPKVIEAYLGGSTQRL